MKKQRKNANPPIARECITCGKVFYIPPSDLKYGRGKYCSRICYKKTGESNPKWKGGKRLIGGYFYVYSPNHPSATRQGYVCEHRLVMEQKLKRILQPSEIVHHLNEVKTDNRIENLFVTDRAKHMTIHHKGIKQTAEHIRRRFANRTYDVSERKRDSLGRFT